MRSANVPGIFVETASLPSKHLRRDLIVDFYLPKSVADPSEISLLLINDGQDMEELGLEKMLTELYQAGAIRPILCAAIHAGKERRREYGVAGHPDYLGRGDRADSYTSFIRKELIPHILQTYKLKSFSEMAFAGFSLGGLMALDIAWNHPREFSKAGVFSGSLWWRDTDQDDPDYDDHKHRIIHQRIRRGFYQPGMKFFFQCGNKDEVADRNNNGIIDSIDDTLDLIRELENKGYRLEKDIYYMEMPDGKHDVATWALAMPEFLTWGWGQLKMEN